MKLIFSILLCGFFLVSCQFFAEEAPINFPPAVQIISPASNARIPTGKEVEIKSVATDESFIERIELYVNDDLIRIDSPPIKGGQVTFTVLQRWVPIRAGPVRVRVVAYDIEGTRSHPVGITLEAVGETLAELQPTKVATATPQSTPTTPPPTVTSVPPTATPVPQIEGRVTNFGPLNVRQGPNTGTAQLGWLNPNDLVIGIARNSAGNWAKIRYGTDNHEGWVFAQRVTWLSDFNALPIE